MRNRRVRLLWAFLLLIILCSYADAEISKYDGHDTRWQRYTEVRKRPYKEITLLHHHLDHPPVLSTDRQRGLYVAPSGCQCFKKGNTSTIQLIDLNTGNNLLILEGHLDSTQCLAFSPDMKKAISGGSDRRGEPYGFDNTLRVWDLLSGEQIAVAKAHKKLVRSVAYSPSGDLAISGGDDGIILLWDVEKMRVVKEFTGHTSGIRPSCLVWSRDGKRFLSGSWDGSIRLWDIQTDKEVAHLQAGHGRLMSLALSPDGKYALSSYLSGDNQPVIFWDLEKQQEINRFGVPGNPWHTDQQLHVATVAFSPDGKTALFGLVFGTVIWWDLDEWRQIGINRLHEDELAVVAFSADGKSCISIGRDTDTAEERAKVKFCQLSSFERVELPAKMIKLAVDDKMNTDLIYIEPSSFIMGDTSGDERPQRKVTITKGFYIGKYKVTCIQFCKFLNAIDNPQDYVALNKYARIEMKDGVYVPKPDCGNGAINVVHWQGAVAFCEWLSHQTARTVRLPTEAEWEFVARGSEGRGHPWGWGRKEWVKWTEHRYKGNKKYPHPWSCASVDAFPENVTPDGVVGMVGNVGEWCSDFFRVRYLKNDVIDPKGPRENDLSGKSISALGEKYHVYRGWGTRATYSTTERNYGNTVGNSGTYGFRIVVELPKKVRTDN